MVSLRQESWVVIVIESHLQLLKNEKGAVADQLDGFGDRLSFVQARVNCVVTMAGKLQPASKSLELSIGEKARSDWIHGAMENKDNMQLASLSTLPLLAEKRKSSDQCGFDGARPVRRQIRTQ